MSANMKSYSYSPFVTYFILIYKHHTLACLQQYVRNS